MLPIIFWSRSNTCGWAAGMDDEEMDRQLYGLAAALNRFVPQQFAPASIITFSLPDAPAAVRMRLNRRLHGYAAWREQNGQRERVKYVGLIAPPAQSLGKGVLLVPGELRAAVIEALQEAGAVYSQIPIWLAYQY
jgi:hypothetical protein